MPAASAKRPASSRTAPKRKGRARHQLAKRPAGSAPGSRATGNARAAAPEGVDGPGYQFGGFRMMCRHRHIRH